MRGFAGTVAVISGGYLCSFAVVENESPRGAALPVLIGLFVVAIAYLLLSSKQAVARFPVLGRLPGAKVAALDQQAAFQTQDKAKIKTIGGKISGFDKVGDARDESEITTEGTDIRKSS